MVNLEKIPGVPKKNATFFTKHETTAFCLIAKIAFDSERVYINLNFDTLASPIRKIFFETLKSNNRNVFFQEAILGDFRGINFTHTSLHRPTLELPKMVYI